MFEVRYSRSFQTVFLFLIPAVLCSLAYSKVIYVDEDTVGANDGSSWENAYVYLQDALADANSAEKPVEIQVAHGIYKPDQGANQTRGDNKATFQLINGVILKGGYAGLGGVDPNERDITSYETILSGDLNVDDREVVFPFNLSWWESNRTDNSYHVVTSSGNDGTAVLDGLNIMSGTAKIWDSFSPSTSEADRRGGGMYNVSSNPTLFNCTFSLNWADSIGGGMYNFMNSSPILTYCTFSENSAGLGGGMYNEGKSSPTLNNCNFIGNLAGHSGGMSNNENCKPTLTNCTFIGNLALFGAGGMENALGCDPILTNCTFSQNSAEYGGGMVNMIDSNPIMTNCIFSRNTAEDDGGGVCNFASSPVLINCTFAQNSAENGNAIGSDIVYDYYRIDPNNMELINCILWDGGDEIWNEYGSPTIITYCNIQGGQAGIFDPSETVTWSEGNIDVDPEFVRAGYWTEPSPRNPNSSVWIEGDYHLKSEAGRWDPVGESWIMDNITSPCIDAGDPNIPIGDEPDPNGGRINMGAYGGTAEASKSPSFSWWFETTQGPILARGLGIVLPHEHIFTDLRGPTTPGYGQADATDVVRVMAPLLTDAREKGVGVMFECSSIGVGRNVSIIAQVAEVSGLPVVVPTGVYGRANFAPPEHRNMTEDELKTLFISEIRDGIEDTGIKAGFIKIATDDGPMNALIEKILRAAGRAASETGAAIASHTPVGSNAVRQVDILDSIDPAIKFIWVHAQNEGNRSLHLQLAARGAYIEFDSLGWNPAQDSMYIAAIKNLLAAGHGDRILLSHDAGWYRPGQANGGTQKPYTYLIDTFIPKLRDAGVDDATIRMITQTNPVHAFGFKSDE